MWRVMCEATDEAEKRICCLVGLGRGFCTSSCSCSCSFGGGGNTKFKIGQEYDPIRTLERMSSK